ncbi:hypothetical protein [Breoghania sp.]|uniref:hypothetical protein n=1 Tax=Breoghania sp. TaxID=2065378 RepID=UPI0026055075|nr:hypothetical protein [Breoghania sp.]
MNEGVLCADPEMKYPDALFPGDVGNRGPEFLGSMMERWQVEAMVDGSVLVGR